ncbi:MAG: hypothetical protein R3A44_05730 [Caldilineaceae bacterium]
MIDFHYHYSSYSYNAWSPPNKVEDILQEMESLAIERRFIFPYFNPSGYADTQANAEILATCRVAPEHLIPVVRASFPVDLYHELSTKFRSLNSEYASVARMLNFLGAMRHVRSKIVKSSSVDDFESSQFNRLQFGPVTALKFHNEEDGSLNAKRFLQIQERFQLLIIHIDPFELELLLDTVGMRNDFVIILAHFGSFSLLHWQIDKAVELTKKFKNLYVDCSAIFAKNVVQHYLPILGSKIVFGSDGPCFSTQATIVLLKETDGFNQIKVNSSQLGRKIQ